MAIADEWAGESARCPACTQGFVVPIPESALETPTEPPAQAPITKCARCNAELATGTTICPHCHTDTSTGRRLPWLARLRRAPLRTGVPWLLAAVATVITLSFAISTYRHWQKDPSPRSPAATAPAKPLRAWADELLQTSDEAIRRKRFDQLAHAGPGAPAAIYHALTTAWPPDSDDARQLRSIRSAFRLLGRLAEGLRTQAETGPAPLPRMLELLTRAEAFPGLRAEARRTRARLGDETVAETLLAQWREECRTVAFFEHYATFIPDNDAALQLIERAQRAQLDASTNALRVLQQRQPSTRILTRASEYYWTTWSWLGQERGEAFAAELFSLAKPPPPAGEQRQLDFDEEKEAIRAARRALEAVSAHDSVLASAAAALTMLQYAPQYRSARQRIVRRIAEEFANASTDAQQRLTWALAELTGRQFGDTTGASHPADVRREDIRQVLRWAGVSEPPRSNDLPPPIWTYRVVTPDRQREFALLADFRQGDPPAIDALPRWFAADLGFTPRIERLLDPRHRDPHPGSLAAAMIIAAQTDSTDQVNTLSIWAESSDQSPWLRTLARTVCAVLDAPAARAGAAWPTPEDVSTFAALPTDAPQWRYFAWAIHAGGDTLRNRVQNLPEDGPAGRARDKLLRALRAVQPLPQTTRTR